MSARGMLVQVGRPDYATKLYASGSLRDEQRTKENYYFFFSRELHDTIKKKKST